MSKLDKAKENLIGKIDDLFGFNLSNRQDGISYDFGQYRLNKLYKPLVKYFIDQYMSHLEQYSQQEAEKILWLFSDFFSLYYSNWDFWYFKNKFSTYQYRIPYSGKDTEFWRATKDCYYVKTSDVVNDMAVSLWGIFENREVQIKMFKKTESTKTDSGEDKYTFDVQIEDIIDEESEEITWYKVIFINYEESKDTKKQKETMIADVLESKWIQYSNPAIKKSIDEFLKKRGRDYFIHKRLKAFLTEELERYFFQMLKTDIQAKADILSIQKKIEEIKAKYSDDQSVIDFKIGQLMKESQSDVKLSLYETSYLWILNFVNILADLEEFKAKLWNKKRKIVKQEYCITIGKINEYETLVPRKNEIFKEILSNEWQINEWDELLKAWHKHLDKITLNLVKSELQSWLINMATNMVVDTKHFDKSSKLYQTLQERWQKKLYEEWSKLDGILIKSENYQWLNVLLDDYKNQIQWIYIDPPFNLGENWDFLYKTDYLDGSWCSLLADRYLLAQQLMKDEGSIFTRCDYHWINLIRNLKDMQFGVNNYNSEIIVSRKRQSIWTSNKLEEETERLFLYNKTQNSVFNEIYKDRLDDTFKWTWFLKQEVRNPRERIFFWKTFLPPEWQHFSLIQLKCDKLIKEHYLRLKSKSKWYVLYYDENKTLNKYKETLLKTEIDKFKYKDISNKEVYWITDLWDLPFDFDLSDLVIQYLPSSTIKVWNNRTDITWYSSSTWFATENSETLLKRCIDIITNEKDIVLDYFVWSATTQAVAQKIGRKWIWTEIWNQFEEYDIPRLKSIIEGKQSLISKEISYKWWWYFTYLYLNQYENRFNSWWYLDKIEWDINQLSNTDVAKISDIKQILFPLSQLKDRIYGLDDEIIW